MPDPLDHQRVLHGRRHADRARHAVRLRTARSPSTGPAPASAWSIRDDHRRARARPGRRRHCRACGSRTRRGPTPSWCERAADRAALLLELRRPGPFHVGVLLDNVPEFPLWLSAAALVGRHHRRHQPDAARRRAGPRHHATPTASSSSPSRAPALLEGLDLGLGDDRVLVTDTDGLRRAARAVHGARRSRTHEVDRTRPLPPAVHLGHDRRAQGGALLAGSPRRHRRRASPRCSSSPATTSATRRCRCSTPTRSWPVGRRRWRAARRWRCAGGSRRRASCPTSAATA